MLNVLTHSLRSHFLILRITADMRTAQIVSVMCDRCDVVGLVLVAIRRRSGALNNAV